MNIKTFISQTLIFLAFLVAPPSKADQARHQNWLYEQRQANADMGNKSLDSALNLNSSSGGVKWLPDYNPGDSFTLLMTVANNRSNAKLLKVQGTSGHEIFSWSYRELVADAPYDDERPFTLPANISGTDFITAALVVEHVGDENASLKVYVDGKFLAYEWMPIASVRGRWTLGDGLDGRIYMAQVWDEAKSADFISDISQQSDDQFRQSGGDTLPNCNPCDFFEKLAGKTCC